tara:strand:+ start:686 stop:4030 length:3345 start_codon:yes stop_codon:yes gene_type:complete
VKHNGEDTHDIRRAEATYRRLCTSAEEDGWRVVTVWDYIPGKTQRDPWDPILYQGSQLSKLESAKKKFACIFLFGYSLDGESIYFLDHPYFFAQEYYPLLVDGPHLWVYDIENHFGLPMVDYFAFDDSGSIRIYDSGNEKPYLLFDERFEAFFQTWEKPQVQDFFKPQVQDFLKPTADLGAKGKPRIMGYKSLHTNKERYGEFSAILCDISSEWWASIPAELLVHVTSFGIYGSTSNPKADIHRVREQLSSLLDRLPALQHISVCVDINLIEPVMQYIRENNLSVVRILLLKETNSEYEPIVGYVQYLPSLQSTDAEVLLGLSCDVVLPPLSSIRVLFLPSSCISIENERSLSTSSLESLQIFQPKEQDTSIPFPLLIRSIPKSLVQLKLNNCEITDATSIAEALQTHSTLRYLNLSFNRIAVCPSAFQFNKSLQYVYFDGNNMVIPPQDLVFGWKWSAERMREFLRQPRSRPDSVRLLMVGNGGVGKSTLLRAISAKEKPSNIEKFLERNEATRMAETWTWFPLKELVKGLYGAVGGGGESKRGMERFVVWDFAGQMEYYHLHRHFLPCRSAVYVVVCKSGKGEKRKKAKQEVVHWLSFIRSQIPQHIRSLYHSQGHGEGQGKFRKPSVVVVGTHGDKSEGEGGEKNVEEKRRRDWISRLREEYKDCFEIYEDMIMISYKEAWEESVWRARDVICELGEVQCASASEEWEVKFHLEAELKMMRGEDGESEPLYVELQSLRKYLHCKVSDVKQKDAIHQLRRILNHLEEALQYLDFQGSIVWRGEVIFVSPQRLFGLMAKFVELPEEVMNEPRQSGTKKVNSVGHGLISKVDIEKIICGEENVSEKGVALAKEVIEVMGNFGLCTPWVRSKNDLYFFPSHLEKGEALAEEVHQKRFKYWNKNCSEDWLVGMEWRIEKKGVDMVPPGLFASVQIAILQYMLKLEEVQYTFTLESVMVYIPSSGGVDILLRVEQDRGVWMIVKATRQGGAVNQEKRIVGDFAAIVEYVFYDSFQQPYKVELMCPKCFCVCPWSPPRSDDGVPLRLNKESRMRLQQRKIWSIPLFPNSSIRYTADKPTWNKIKFIHEQVNAGVRTVIELSLDRDCALLPLEYDFGKQ